jgi:uncharacterized protein
MTWYLYRLIPPRPDFGSTMSDTERAAMGEHVVYWTGHLEAGKAIIFSPVADPAGDWGMAVVNVDSFGEIQQLGENDPAVIAGVARYDALLLPAAIVPG